MVLVRKVNNRWSMFVDFIDMNIVYPKDLFPLSDIDHFIDESSGYETLSFMDAYSGYKHIQMDPLESLKTSFISNHDNYYYNVIPFSLKNDGTTYQRLVDTVFSNQIGQNVEVNVDDMIVKTTEGAHPC